MRPPYGTWSASWRSRSGPHRPRHLHLRRTAHRQRHLLAEDGHPAQEGGGGHGLATRRTGRLRGHLPDLDEGQQRQPGDMDPRMGEVRGRLGPRRGHRRLRGGDIRPQHTERLPTVDPVQPRRQRGPLGALRSPHLVEETASGTFTVLLSRDTSSPVRSTTALARPWSASALAEPAPASTTGPAARTVAAAVAVKRRAGMRKLVLAFKGGTPRREQLGTRQELRTESEQSATRRDFTPTWGFREFVRISRHRWARMFPAVTHSTAQPRTRRSTLRSTHGGA